MALQHRRAGFVELTMESLDDRRMVVAGVVDAIAAEEIQNPASVCGMQHLAAALGVGAVQVEQVQQIYPLRVDVLFVTGRPGGRIGRRRTLGAGSVGSRLYGRFRKWHELSFPLSCRGISGFP